MTTTEQTLYPLIFTYRDAVSGNGFLAGVTVTGRALMTQEEDDRWWMFGVRPAGIAEAGATPNETFMSFRARYRAVLFDIAEESENFEAFKNEVEAFFYESDRSEETRWVEAHKLIRSGTVQPEEPFSALRKEAPEGCPSMIAVARLDNSQSFTTSDNVPDTYLIPTATAA